MIAAGRKSKTCRTASRIASGSACSVPNVSRFIDVGCAVPIAYATWSCARSARPAATTFLVAYRAMYAADRSTLVGSLPLNAPPCGAMPP